jgi:hypothetical protein
MNDDTKGRVVSQQLWAGVELKLAYAHFHLEEMGRSISYRQPSQHEVAVMTSGAVFGGNWQRTFYPHFDAFLAAARSIPSIIEACFGADRGSSEMKEWFGNLNSDERDRRSRFRRALSDSLLYKACNDHPLTHARNTVLHRTGVAALQVKISDFFGVVHTGGPLSKIPTATSHPSNQWIPGSHPMQIEPWHGGEFTIDGVPLFESCHGYLDAATKLISEAREIVGRIHGHSPLTSPP